MKKIAYLILAHDDPHHLVRLIHAIDYQCDFYIHIDKKQAIETFKSLNDLPNVHFCDKRYDISWGGFHMVKATLELMRECLAHGETYSHLVLLSGNDYPIKNKQDIYQYFIDHDGVEIIRAYDIKDSHCQHCYEKVEKYHYFDRSYKFKRLNKLVNKFKSMMMKPFHKQLSIQTKQGSLHPCFGSQWWALTPDCSTYILNSDLDQMKRYFKTAYAPDEMFFHTIIFNSQYRTKTLYKGVEPFSEKWKWNNFHFMLSDDLNCKLVKQPHFIKRIISAFKKEHPYNGSLAYLDLSFFNDIKESPHLFARKLNTQYSTSLLHEIDQLIG